MTRWSPWLVVLAALVFRLAHLGDVHFVNPDGATYLRYDLLIYTQRLPLYPILLHTLAALGLSMLTAGKLVAALCACAAIYVVTLIGGELAVGKRWTWVAAVSLAVDPLFALHTVQPLTEGAFAFFAALATWFALRLIRTEREFDLWGLVFCAGLSALTRAEGLVFAPLCLWGIVYVARRAGWLASFISLVLGLLPWVLFLVWQAAIVRRAGYLGEFGESVSASTMTGVLLHAALHLKSIAYHFGIVGVIPLFIGWRILRRASRGWPRTRHHLWVLTYLLLTTWLGISIHWHFDLRFATPLIIWLSPIAGFGWQRILSGGPVTRRLGQALLVAQIVAWLVVSSAMIQQVGDLAADVSRAAEIAGQTSPQTPLVSDEQAMTSYYAGRVALPYRLPIRFRRAVVVLHDRYVDLHAERAKLERDFEVRELGSAFAQGAHGAAWRAVVWSISRRGSRAASVSTAPTTAPGG